jgi:hypothetical protein
MVLEVLLCIFVTKVEFHYSAGFMLSELLVDFELK